MQSHNMGKKTRQSNEKVKAREKDKRERERERDGRKKEKKKRGREKGGGERSRKRARKKGRKRKENRGRLEFVKMYSRAGDGIKRALVPCELKGADDHAENHLESTYQLPVLYWRIRN